MNGDDSAALDMINTVSSTEIIKICFERPNLPFYIVMRFRDERDMFSSIHLSPFLDASTANAWSSSGRDPFNCPA